MKSKSKPNYTKFMKKPEPLDLDSPSETALGPTAGEDDGVRVSVVPPPPVRTESQDVPDSASASCEPAARGPEVASDLDIRLTLSPPTVTPVDCGTASSDEDEPHSEGPRIPCDEFQLPQETLDVLEADRHTEDAPAQERFPEIPEPTGRHIASAGYAFPSGPELLLHDQAGGEPQTPTAAASIPGGRIETEVAIPEGTVSEVPPVIPAESGIESSPPVLDPGAFPGPRSGMRRGDDVDRPDTIIPGEPLTNLPCVSEEAKHGQEAIPATDRMLAQEPPEPQDPDRHYEHPPADATSREIPERADQDPAAEVRGAHPSPEPLLPDQASREPSIGATSVTADTPSSPDIPWAEILPDAYVSPVRPHDESSRTGHGAGSSAEVAYRPKKTVRLFESSERPPVPEFAGPWADYAVQWSDVSPHAERQAPVPDERPLPEPDLAPPYWIAGGPPIPALLFGCALLLIALAM